MPQHQKQTSNYWLKFHFALHIEVVIVSIRRRYRDTFALQTYDIRLPKQYTLHYLPIQLRCRHINYQRRPKSSKVWNTRNNPPHIVDYLRHCLIFYTENKAAALIFPNQALFPRDDEYNRFSPMNTQNNSNSRRPAFGSSFGCTKENPRLSRGEKKALAESKEKKNPSIEQKWFADHTSTIERDSN